MTIGSKEFYTFEKTVSFYRFFTNALGQIIKGMILAHGYESHLDHKFIKQKYLIEVYHLRKNIQEKNDE